MEQQQERKFGFKSIQLFKDQTLGIGSYGAVCKAKCDDLLCAAKILHPTLFDPNAQLQIPRKKEHRLPIKRFEQECEFLSTIRHPNIVQYLCMHQDPDTGLPVLLMELMDESLTHFLENSPQPIAYHIQVNICYDISLALSFLHSNGIIHRDLSGNNVLMRRNMLAKVTDFGMAALGDLNPQATRYTFTMCPGTDVYMPPEAVKDEPLYTEKIDCFSFGVILVQLLTRQFPKPGNRRQEVEVNQPGLPRGTVEVRLAEIDRRQNDINQVDPNNLLLPIALDCLKDKDTERPSAQQLCERVASLKERQEYSDSVAGAQQEKHQLRQQLQQLQQFYREETQQMKDDHKRQLEQLRQRLQELQQSSRREEEKTVEQTGHTEQQQLQEQREEIDRQLEQLRQQLQELRQKSAREREENERQLEQVEQQQQEVIQQIVRENERELEQLRQQLQELQQSSRSETDGQTGQEQLQECIQEKDRELEQLRQQVEKQQHKHQEVIQRIVSGNKRRLGQMERQLQEVQQSSTKEREESDRNMGQMMQKLDNSELERGKLESELCALKKRLHELEEERDRNMGEMVQQLDSCEQQRTKLESELRVLKEQLRQMEKELLRLKDQKQTFTLLQVEASNGTATSSRSDLKLVLSAGMKAPFASKRWCDATVDGNRVYFVVSGAKLRVYDTVNMKWSHLPSCVYYNASLKVINGLPTTIGGSPALKDPVNKLMSLTEEGRGGVWREIFPPMPTRREFVTAACTGTVLIVAGGRAEKELTTVEVLNIKNCHWSTAAHLPEPLHCFSATVSDNLLYMLGGAHSHFPGNSVYTCSVSALIQSCTQCKERTNILSLSSDSSDDTGVWGKLADIPVTESTCVTFYGQLLAVGGLGSDRKPTTAVYMYNQSTNSWNVISHMTNARRYCFAAVLPDNQLMVVGGEINKQWTCSDSVEFGYLI